MSLDRAMYDRFSAALLGDDPTAAAELLTPNTAHRIAVYRANGFASLRQVLEDLYPVTVGLLGRNFRMFAWRYTQAHPSQEYSLDHYGAHFPEFLAEQPEIVETQPALVYFAWVDFFLHHPRAPAQLELTLPARLFEHYQAFLTTGQLADGELGALSVFCMER